MQQAGARECLGSPAFQSFLFVQARVRTGGLPPRCQTHESELSAIGLDTNLQIVTNNNRLTDVCVRILEGAR